LDDKKINKNSKLIKFKKNNDNMKKKYYVNIKNLYENILISLKDNVKFFR